MDMLREMTSGEEGEDGERSHRGEDGGEIIL